MFENFADYVYSVYDKVADYPIGFVIAKNDSEAVRRALLSLRCPIRDCELYKIGSFKTRTEKFNFLARKSPILVDWSNYRFPENVSEAIAPLGATPEEISEIVASVAKSSEVINE